MNERFTQPPYRFFGNLANADRITKVSRNLMAFVMVETERHRAAMADGTQANHVLTFKLDHSSGADRLVLMLFAIIHGIDRYL